MSAFPQLKRTPIKRSGKPIRKRSKKNSIVPVLDGLVRTLIIARDGGCCVKCGGDNVLQAAHILPKSHYPRLRYELWNVLTMCKRCHIFWAHKDPIGFIEWLDLKYPGRRQELLIMQATARKLDLKELRIALQIEVKNL